MAAILPGLNVFNLRVALSKSFMKCDTIGEDIFQLVLSIDWGCVKNVGLMIVYFCCVYSAPS